MRPPKKNSITFRPFLAIFTLFHLKNWPYLQKPEFGNLAETWFWLLLVNNELCSMPPSWTPPDINIMPGESCVTDLSQNDISILVGWLAIPISITRCRTNSSTSGTAAHMAMVRWWPVSWWTTLADASTQQGDQSPGTRPAQAQKMLRKSCWCPRDFLGGKFWAWCGEELRRSAVTRIYLYNIQISWWVSVTIWAPNYRVFV